MAPKKKRPSKGKSAPKKDAKKGKRKVFTRSIRLRNGKILDAADVGKKVFVFWVDD